MQRRAAIFARWSGLTAHGAQAIGEQIQSPSPRRLVLLLALQRQDHREEHESTRFRRVGKSSFHLSTAQRCCPHTLLAGVSRERAIGNMVNKALSRQVVDSAICGGMTRILSEAVVHGGEG